MRVVPFQLHKIANSPRRPVFIVEGEKDVLALAKVGLLATCNAGGAGKWKAEHTACLGGRKVIVLPDNDEPGRKHAQAVAFTLNGIAESIHVVELPGLPDKGDVSDWLAAGRTADELVRIVKAAPEWTPESQPWHEIVSLTELSLPGFPSNALPDVLCNWVEAESCATQTPLALAGLLGLAVCSAVIARRVVVEARQGWIEPTNLFVTILLESGNRKSAVFSDAVQPLRDLEFEYIEDAKQDFAQRMSEYRQAEARLKKLEKKASDTGDAEARREACDFAVEFSQMEMPVLPRLLVDDATSEKLGMILSDQGGRIASMSPEGSVFDLMDGKYDKKGTPQFDVYLKGHSGDDLLTDRVGRESVRVKSPSMTCAFAVQPAVIEGLARNAVFRGRGLLARFLYACCQILIA